jgi:putative DNA primase/helicase
MSRDFVAEALVSSGLISQCAADITPEQVDWLWPGRIARGKHTCIGGEPGDGKSQLTIFITAVITTGGYWPCGEGQSPVGSVIVLSAEDGAADTIVPRLMAAGADRNRVHLVSAVVDSGNRRAFNLQRDIEALERKIAEVGDVALVIFDPVSSYLGKTDSHKNSEVRGVLEPLSEMGERLGVAILSVTHFSKTGSSNTTKALHRFIGSIAFTGAPRCAFAVIADAENSGRMLFLHAKNNLAAKPQGLAYRLEQCIVDQPGSGIVASRIVWENNPVAITADQALAAEAGSTEARGAREEAGDFLRRLLAEGAMDAKEIRAQCTAAGLAWATVRRAKDRLGIKPERESEGSAGDGKWVWSLPPEECKVLKNSQGVHFSKVSPLQKFEHLAANDGDDRAVVAPVVTDQVTPVFTVEPTAICVQCGAGSPPLVCNHSSSGPVFLHRECKPFYFGKR